MGCLLMALVALTSDTSASQNWPAFLADGSSRTSARRLPLQWSPEKGVAWQAEVRGYGQSSPVVWGGRVFVTSIEGEQKERCLVHAFDLKSGSRQWARHLEASQKKEYGFMVSRAAPTPAVDQDGLYVFFESGDLASFSHAGEPRWQRSLVKDYGEFQSGHGIGSSLAQTDNAVIVLAAHDGPSYLLAVDKASGKTLWKADRESRVAWTSPIVASAHGRAQVVVSCNGNVQSYDASDGGLLWTLEGISGNTLPSASKAGDRLLIGAGVSRRNPDAAAASRSNCCLQLTNQDGQPGYKVAWSASKATASYATPLAHRGCAYFVNKVGVVYCLDLASGQQHYAERIDAPCWATPLGAGDHVYFFTKKGVATVLKAGPKFEKVASNHLWDGTAEPAEADGQAPPGFSSAYLDPIVYAAAAVDDNLLVRTGNKLYCVRKTPTP